jgi:hypothetical protein
VAQDSPAVPATAEAQNKPRTRPLKTLPTERIKFERQLDLIRAYGVTYRTTNKPVANIEVAKSVGMQESTTSMANAFFTSIGILQRGGDGKFTPASEVLDFATAYDWGPESAPQKLRPLLARTWFGEALLPRVSFNAMEESKAQEVLALAASASKEYRAQIAMLIDYLAVGGVVQRDGGLIRARDGGDVPQAATPGPCRAECSSPSTCPWTCWRWPIGPPTESRPCSGGSRRYSRPRAR